MTVERDIDVIVAGLPLPPGRNPEHDLAQLARAFLRKAQNGEPWIANGGATFSNDMGATNEAYVNALWEALPDFVEWALDAAAQYRTIQLCAPEMWGEATEKQT